MLSQNRRLISQEDAALIERARVPRSRFEGSWTRKTTFDAGYLVPFLLDEVLPGDHMSYDVDAYVRLATPLFPIMDSQRIDTFFFYVPNRILWSNWVKFMGEQAAPGDSIAFTIPTVTSPTGGWPQNSLYDHMGLPVAGQITAGEQIQVNALPFRAYQLIYNQWFRDQNLVTAGAPPTGDAGDGTYSLHRRAKAHDYFTSALPWPQKFTNTAVPIAGTAPVLGLGKLGSAYATSNVTVRESDNTSSIYTTAQKIDPGIAANEGDFYVQMGQTGFPNIYADLSQATGVTVNQLRLAFMTQQLLELDARGGTRYGELLFSHFGVNNPDARLQRPEYLGGGGSHRSR